MRKTMENKACLMILLSTLLLSYFFIAQSSALMKQTDVLWRLQKKKLMKFNTDVDNSSFDITSDNDFHHEMKFVHLETGQKKLDQIKRLPGQPQVNFKQYGGYVTVNQTAGRALYYYFVEAENSTNKLPLLLWLNGGPGCSSLGYGAMTELGPFRVNSDGKTLYTNDFAWNKVANVLFLESPAGVGFSYSNTRDDIETSGDNRTANDNYVFLVNWLEKFPEYKNRDFYISGESYAGHYVPQLTHIILYQNRKANNTNIINLKGIIIGNAVINDETDVEGMFQYLASHALISDDTGYQIKENCDFYATKQSDQCNQAIDEAFEDIESINIYNIYAPLCSSPNLTEKPKNPSPLGFDPCSIYYVYAYLNSPDAQKALNANVTNISDYDWQLCSDVLQNWTDSPNTVINLLEEFMANGLRVWIFSGDVDGRVPVTSTQLSLKQMKLRNINPWHAWTVSNEVGGYTEEYDGNLTFVTVRAAGHQVATYQPARALSLIENFLGGKKLTD